MTVTLAKYPATAKTPARMVISMSNADLERLHINKDTHFEIRPMGPSIRVQVSGSGPSFRPVIGNRWRLVLAADTHTVFINLPGFGVTDTTIADSDEGWFDVRVPASGERNTMIKRGVRATQHGGKITEPQPKVTNDSIRDAVATLKRAKEEMGDELILSIDTTTGVVRALVQY